MINKNSFSYVSSYNKLLTVQMLHNYFDDNLFRDVSFSVENETKSILKNYDIIFKPNVNGFSLINKIENYILNFDESICNKYFFVYFVTNI